MTREEAINKAINIVVYFEAHFAKSKEAREEAINIIEALEQEPCKDYIGREEAKQFLYERIDRLNDDELYDIFSRIIDDMYNELPFVTPQPKTGRWIDDKCSVCGKGTEDLIDSREWYRNEEPNFCPFCGLELV